MQYRGLVFDVRTLIAIQGLGVWNLDRKGKETQGPNIWCQDRRQYSDPIFDHIWCPDKKYNTQTNITIHGSSQEAGIHFLKSGQTLQYMDPIFDVKTGNTIQGSNTGQPRYVKLAYLEDTAYVEVIIHSRAFPLYCFVFQTCLCRTWLSRNLDYIEVVFHSRKSVFRFITTTCVKVNFVMVKKIKKIWMSNKVINLQTSTIALNSVQNNPLLWVIAN